MPVKFTGTLRYKDGEHLYIDLGPNGVQYFGSPSNLIDDAWQELLIGLSKLFATIDSGSETLMRGP